MESRAYYDMSEGLGSGQEEAWGRDAFTRLVSTGEFVAFWNYRMLVLDKQNFTQGLRPRFWKAISASINFFPLQAIAGALNT